MQFIVSNCCFPVDSVFAMKQLPKEFGIELQIEFGTDMTDVPTETVLKNDDYRNEMIYEFLSENGPVDRMGRKGTGLGLSQAALDKIFAGNFEKRVGPKPRPLSESGVNAYAEWLMPYLTPAERKTAEDLLRR